MDITGGRYACSPTPTGPNTRVFNKDLGVNPSPVVQVCLDSKFMLPESLEQAEFT